MSLLKLVIGTKLWFNIWKLGRRVSACKGLEYIKKIL